jgi:hypothetical protein
LIDQFITMVTHAASNAPATEEGVTSLNLQKLRCISGSALRQGTGSAAPNSSFAIHVDTGYPIKTRFGL